MRVNELKKGLVVKTIKLNQELIITDWNESCVLFKTRKGKALSHKYQGKFLQYDHTYLPMWFIKELEIVKASDEI